MRVALLQGPQLLGEARSRQVLHMQFAEQSVVMGAGLLVDLDPVVLGGDPVPAGIRMLLYHCLDGRHLLWLDRRGAVFYQGDHAVYALPDREAWLEVRDHPALTLAPAPKVIAAICSFWLSPLPRVPPSP